MTDFGIQLKNAYQEKVVGTLEKKVRAAALVVDAELAITTPIDTGRARANWLPSLNTPDVRIVEPGTPHEISGILSSYKITDQILITNNLPYIRKLNDGYSKQAPAAFVESAIEKGRRAIK